MFEKISITNRFVKPTNVTEWQEYAVRLCQDLSIPNKDKSRIFKAVRDLPRIAVETAKTFCLDYTGRVPVTEMFFWRVYNDPAKPGEEPIDSRLKKE